MMTTKDQGWKSVTSREVEEVPEGTVIRVLEHGILYEGPKVGIAEKEDSWFCAVGIRIANMCRVNSGRLGSTTRSRFRPGSHRWFTSRANENRPIGGKFWVMEAKQ
jgi:hypothetical protein